MLVAQRPRKTKWKPLGTLNEAVSLIGGHLYCDEDVCSAGGVVEKVTEGGNHLWIETKRSPEQQTKGIALSTKHCEWTQEVYIQCHAGTFGCITISDPINGNEISIHGVRLNS